MSVALTPEGAAFVREAVGSGRFASSSDVVDAALRQLKEQQELFGYSLDELRSLVEEGLDSGAPLDGEEVLADLRARVAREEKRVS